MGFRMRFFLIILLLFFDSQVSVWGQIGTQHHFTAGDFQEFEIEDDGEAYHFIAGSDFSYGSNGFKKEGPVLIWLEGIEPKPVISEWMGGVNILPFRMIPQAYVVKISPPGIPVRPGNGTLDFHGNYVEKESGLPPTEYSEKADLAYYVKMVGAVVNYLAEQPWVQKDGIAVAGIHDSALIALEVAAQHPKVSHTFLVDAFPGGKTAGIFAKMKYLRDSGAWDDELFRQDSTEFAAIAATIARDSNSRRMFYELTQPEPGTPPPPPPSPGQFSRSFNRYQTFWCIHSVSQPFSMDLMQKAREVVFISQKGSPYERAVEEFLEELQEKFPECAEKTEVDTYDRITVPYEEEEDWEKIFFKIMKKIF